MARRPSWRRVGTRNEAARIEWVSEVLKKLPAGSRLLDAGAGEQPFKQFCQHLHYVSQDFAQYEPRADKAGLHDASWTYTSLDIVSDITAIPEPDGSFDAILCTEVLEHIPDPASAIREFARLLRRGGHLILTAPFGSLTHQAPYHFATGFSRYFYEHTLPTNGFDVLEITPNGNYFECLAQEIHRVRAVGRRYARSRMSVLDVLGAVQLLRMLSRFSRRDHGSAELGVFGYHVRALKRS